MLCCEHIAIIAGIPVKDIPDPPDIRLLLLLKPIVHFYQKLEQNIQIFRLLLEGIDDRAPKLRIQEAEHLSILSELPYRIRRVGVAVLIALGKDVLIQPFVPRLKFCKGEAPVLSTVNTAF